MECKNTLNFRIMNNICQSQINTQFETPVAVKILHSKHSMPVLLVNITFQVHF